MTIQTDARDDFLKYLETLPPEAQQQATRIADHLWELVQLPHALNAFAMVSAELAALHSEGKLLTDRPLFVANKKVIIPN